MFLARRHCLSVVSVICPGVSSTSGIPWDHRLCPGVFAGTYCAPRRSRHAGSRAHSPGPEFHLPTECEQAFPCHPVARSAGRPARRHAKGDLFWVSSGHSNGRGVVGLLSMSQNSRFSRAKSGPWKASKATLCESTYSGKLAFAIHQSERTRKCHSRRSARHTVPSRRGSLIGEIPSCYFRELEL